MQGSPLLKIFVGNGLVFQESQPLHQPILAVLGNGFCDPLVDHVIGAGGVGVGVVAHPAKVSLDAILGEISHNDTLVRRAYHFYLHQSLSGQSSDNISVKHFAQSALYMGDWYIEHDSVKLGEDCFRQAIASSEKIQDWRMCYLSYARLAEQVQWSDEKEALIFIPSRSEEAGTGSPRAFKRSLR